MGGSISQTPCLGKIRTQATPMTRFLYIRISFRGIGARGEELRGHLSTTFQSEGTVFVPTPQPFWSSFKKRLNF